MHRRISLVIIKLSKEIENKHENYFKDKILPKLIKSKLKKHNYNVGSTSNSYGC